MFYLEIKSDIRLKDFLDDNERSEGSDIPKYIHAYMKSFLNAKRGEVICLTRLFEKFSCIELKKNIYSNRKRLHVMKSDTENLIIKSDDEKM